MRQFLALLSVALVSSSPAEDLSEAEQKLVPLFTAEAASGPDTLVLPLKRGMRCYGYFIELTVAGESGLEMTAPMLLDTASPLSWLIDCSRFKSQGKPAYCSRLSPSVKRSDKFAGVGYGDGAVAKGKKISETFNGISQASLFLNEDTEDNTFPGILGLSPLDGSIEFLSRTQLKTSFSLAIPRGEDRGEFRIGEDIEPRFPCISEKLSFKTENKKLWSVELKGMSVEFPDGTNTFVYRPPTSMRSSSKQILFDTGSTGLVVPMAVHAAIIKAISAKDPSYDPESGSPNGDIRAPSKYLPDFVLHFANGKVLRLRSEALFVAGNYKIIGSDNLGFILGAPGFVGRASTFHPMTGEFSFCELDYADPLRAHGILSLPIVQTETGLDARINLVGHYGFARPEESEITARINFSQFALVAPVGFLETRDFAVYAKNQIKPNIFVYEPLIRVGDSRSSMRPFIYAVESPQVSVPVLAVNSLVVHLSQSDRISKTFSISANRESALFGWTPDLPGLQCKPESIVKTVSRPDGAVVFNKKWFRFTLDPLTFIAATTTSDSDRCTLLLDGYINGSVRVNGLSDRVCSIAFGQQNNILGLGAFKGKIVSWNFEIGRHHF